MLTRDEAFKLIKKYLRNQDNIKDSLAVEAIMGEIAKTLGKNRDIWSLTGLLHNLDYEYTAREPEKRGNLTAQLLEGLLPENSVNAIKANNYMHTDYIPTTSLDKSLIAAGAASGLIFVTVKSTESQKLSDVDLPTLIEKYNDSTFAVRFNRKRIGLCADAGLDLNSFLALCLVALQKISDQLGL